MTELGTEHIKFKHVDNSMDVTKKELTQDTHQYISMTGTLCIETYKVIMGSFLLLFLPQECGDGNVCSISENLNTIGLMYNIGIGINLFTFISFLVMYYYEIVRETRFIKYLDVNPSLPRDNDSMQLNLIGMDHSNLDLVLSSDRLYQKFSYNALFWFIFNSVYSAVVIFSADKYLDNQTTIVFLTNILFLSTKIYGAYCIANTEEFIFYSAYLNRQIQFNDMDHDI